MPISMNKWVEKNLGKGIDYDGAYGVQCVDLAKHFIKNVLGVEPQSIGNAIEYYRKRESSKYLTTNFKWISNTPDFVPKKGDLCVFTSKSGNGHISVATGEGTTSYFYSYDQNYPSGKHEPMTKIKHTYASFLGVLRPKNQKNIKTAASASKPNYKTEVGKTYRLKAKTTLYSKPNLSGTKYTYLAQTKLKVLSHASAAVDKIKVIATGREAYCKISKFS